jgi:malic enzyme
MQGTAAVALTGLMAALPIIGGALADHKFLFLDAGEVCPFFLILIYVGGCALWLC